MKWKSSEKNEQKSWVIENGLFVIHDILDYSVDYIIFWDLYWIIIGQADHGWHKFSHWRNCEIPGWEKGKYNLSFYSVITPKKKNIIFLSSWCVFIIEAIQVNSANILSNIYPRCVLTMRTSFDFFLLIQSDILIKLKVIFV